MSALGDFRANMEATNNKKSEMALKMIEDNQAIIKRQSKLITDLKQKSEVYQTEIANTEEMN